MAFPWGRHYKVPHLRKPIARLDRDLYAIKKVSADGSMRIRITLAPGEHVVMDIRVHHRRFAEWSTDRAGALVILPNGLRLCFTDHTTVERSSRTAAYDLNFKRAVFARSDGRQKVIDLSDLISIQENHKRKRESIRWTMAHNAVKAGRLMAKTREREHNRVNDLLHKKIHGEESESNPSSRVVILESRISQGPRRKS